MKEIEREGRILLNLLKPRTKLKKPEVKINSQLLNPLRDKCAIQYFTLVDSTCQKDESCPLTL